MNFESAKRVMRGLSMAAFVSAILFTGCSTDECLDNKNSLPYAGFYSSSESPEKISVDSIDIYGIGAPGDSVLVNMGRNINSVYIPFRIDADKTKYVIRYMQKELAKRNLADTITFRYDPVPYFVSAACGAIYRYEMEHIDCTHHLIDSVTCPRGVIDNSEGENLCIYFRVRK